MKGVLQGPDPERVRAERLGRWGERVALMVFALRGARILDRRARTPFGEVDVVVREAGVLVLVEVKLRRTLEDAKAAVSHEQRGRLALAARHLAQVHRAERVRIDLVALAPPHRWARIRDFVPPQR
jgi:putative endonuclease